MLPSGRFSRSSASGLCSTSKSVMPARRCRHAALGAPLGFSLIRRRHRDSHRGGVDICTIRFAFQIETWKAPPMARTPMLGPSPRRRHSAANRRALRVGTQSQAFVTSKLRASVCWLRHASSLRRPKPRWKRREPTSKLLSIDYDIRWMVFRFENRWTIS